jgi:hypothetical protein
VTNAIYFKNNNYVIDVLIKILHTRSKIKLMPFLSALEKVFWMAACSNSTPHLVKKDQCIECFKTKEKHLTSEITALKIEVPLSNNKVQLQTSAVQSGKLFQEAISKDSLTPFKIHRFPSIAKTNNVKGPAENDCNVTTAISNHAELNAPLSNQNIIKQSEEQYCIVDSTIPTLQRPSFQRKSPRKQIPCKYGMGCYRQNPVHFEKYSHPFEFQRRETTGNQLTTVESVYQDPNSETIADLKVESEVQQQISQLHLDLVEKRFVESIADLKNKNEYYEQEIKKLCEEKKKMAMYHQQLEHALAQELDKRDRREIQKQRILITPRDTPIYWGTNAFSEPFRAIDIRQESPEFGIINDLLNSTIETHNNKYGTIYGKDPTEFIVTQISRIHNEKLWHEYCFKKVNSTSILTSLN